MAGKKDIIQIFPKCRLWVSKCTKWVLKCKRWVPKCRRWVPKCKRWVPKCTLNEFLNVEDEFLKWRRYKKNIFLM